MNRMIESVWSNEKRFLLGKRDTSSALRVPLTDVQQAGNNVVVKLELPGVEKKDLHIIARDNSIEVSAERKSESKVVREGYYRHERKYNKFHRLIPLPASIDVSSVTSELKNGVLIITAKKVKEKGKRILVR